MRNMDIHPGTFIQSTKDLDGTHFEGARIYLVEHNEKGSIGFVVNKPDGRYLNQLSEFVDCPAIPLMEGGPVDHEHLFLLHTRPDLISGGTHVDGDTWWGGKMEDITRALKQHELGTDELKLFIGYCGWDKGELEQELKEGSWLA